MKKLFLIVLFTMIISLPVSSDAVDIGGIIGSAVGGVAKLAESAKEITPAEEHYIGRAVAAIILSTRPLYNNPALTKYVNEVGLLIANASDRPSTYGGYHFAVLASDEANAYACPGGIILINRGLLKQIKNEDQLASVLAHEVAHVVHRHGINAIKKSRWTDLGFYVAGEVGKQYAKSEVGQLVGTFQGVVGDVAKKVMESGYSQSDEKNADLSGVKYASAVGYNTGELVEFIKSGGAATSSGPFSSHPKPEARVGVIETMVAKLSPAASTEPARTERFKGQLAAVR